MLPHELKDAVRLCVGRLRAQSGEHAGEELSKAAYSGWESEVQGA